MVLVSIYDSSGLLWSAYSEIHFLSRDKRTSLEGIEQVRCVLDNATRRWCLSRCICYMSVIMIKPVSANADNNGTDPAEHSCRPLNVCLFSAKMVDMHHLF